MNLPTQSLKHSLKTILGMIALAILVAGMVSRVHRQGAGRKDERRCQGRTSHHGRKNRLEQLQPRGRHGPAVAEALGGQGACALQAPLLQPMARSHALELIARSL